MKSARKCERPPDPKEFQEENGTQSSGGELANIPAATTSISSSPSPTLVRPLQDINNGQSFLGSPLQTDQRISSGRQICGHISSFSVGFVGTLLLGSIRFLLVTFIFLCCGV